MERRSVLDPRQREREAGFALLMALLVLAALGLGSIGIFLSSRTESRIGSSHVAGVQAFHAADAGLVTWFASPVQPASVEYLIGRASVRVEADRIIFVDTLLSIYRISARAVWPVPHGDFGPLGARAVTALGRRAGGGRVEPLVGSWREQF